MARTRAPGKIKEDITLLTEMIRLHESVKSTSQSASASDTSIDEFKIVLSEASEQIDTWTKAFQTNANLAIRVYQPTHDEDGEDFRRFINKKLNQNTLTRLTPSLTNTPVSQMTTEYDSTTSATTKKSYPNIPTDEIKTELQKSTELKQQYNQNLESILDAIKKSLTKQVEEFISVIDSELSITKNKSVFINKIYFDLDLFDEQELFQIKQDINNFKEYNANELLKALNNKYIQRDAKTANIYYNPQIATLLKQWLARTDADYLDAQTRYAKSYSTIITQRNNLLREIRIEGKQIASALQSEIVRCEALLTANIPNIFDEADAFNSIAENELSIMREIKLYQDQIEALITANKQYDPEYKAAKSETDTVYHELNLLESSARETIRNNNSLTQEQKIKSQEVLDNHFLEQGKMISKSHAKATQSIAMLRAIIQYLESPSSYLNKLVHDTKREAIAGLNEAKQEMKTRINNIKIKINPSQQTNYTAPNAPTTTPSKKIHINTNTLFQSPAPYQPDTFLQDAHEALISIVCHSPHFWENEAKIVESHHLSLSSRPKYKTANEIEIGGRTYKYPKPIAPLYEALFQNHKQPPLDAIKAVLSCHETVRDEKTLKDSTKELLAIVDELKLLLLIDEKHSNTNQLSKTFLKLTSFLNKLNDFYNNPQRNFMSESRKDAIEHYNTQIRIPKSERKQETSEKQTLLKSFLNFQGEDDSTFSVKKTKRAVNLVVVATSAEQDAANLKKLF